ncbi:LysR family transcriptional regulator (plasmid) [Sinorhizobium meliloti]|nr:LysR family transcriptional regulator [Sinorhizobium meliloti]
MPPLTTLAVFEAAARHSSFARAAEEMNVTTGAISRQIKSLEDELGVKLFIREKNGVQLTPRCPRPLLRSRCQLLTMFRGDQDGEVPKAGGERDFRMHRRFRYLLADAENGRFLDPVSGYYGQPPHI